MANASTEISRLAPWFHNLHLPNGAETAPDHFLGDFPSYKWAEIADYLPADLTGWRALDIGCNAGFYSFELARRGADVVGIDSDAHYLAQAEWAARQFGLTSQVTFRQQQIYDLARERESYDLVLFMGVFYHLRYPLLGLDLAANLVRRLMVFQTLSMSGEEVYQDTEDHDIMDRAVLARPGWPRMAFIEHRYSGDPTNWWVPNHAAIEAMLRSTGLCVTARPGHEIYLCEPAPENSPTRAPYDFSAETRAATGRPWR
jgi:tRNA (mo5U34)-methyltransferase